nr:MAG TPA: hypothetical protein [Caudoviricetes sp.]
MHRITVKPSRRKPKRAASAHSITKVPRPSPLPCKT